MRCDLMLAVLDGRSIDEGVAFELGFAFGKAANAPPGSESGKPDLDGDFVFWDVFLPAGFAALSTGSVAIFSAMESFTARHC